MDTASGLAWSRAPWRACPDPAARAGGGPLFSALARPFLHPGAMGRLAGFPGAAPAAVPAAALTGCSGEAGPHQEARAATNKTCGTYHYAVLDSSFTGISSTTTIEITADVPTVRRYVETERPAPDEVVTRASWTETGAEIGT